ncbi:hypothetical protein HPB50_024142 [Hyalomma asiaticum]|uniref:Uncharacterized protein n=1 Tax=Hyalomma asiaticum TaxID=266040 RepID=A0ACB7TTY9_HYAAI|nr:hypothetical protein HPB50_024142 [Hyalomma asiaticum]
MLAAVAFTFDSAPGHGELSEPPLPVKHNKRRLSAIRKRPEPAGRVYRLRAEFLEQQPLEPKLRGSTQKPPPPCRRDTRKACLRPVKFVINGDRSESGALGKPRASNGIASGSCMGTASEHGGMFPSPADAHSAKATNHRRRRTIP